MPSRRFNKAERGNLCGFPEWKMNKAEGSREPQNEKCVKLERADEASEWW